MIDRETSGPARVGHANSRHLDVTALIALGWVLAVVYGFLQIIADAVVVTPTLIIADGITLLAAWAVIEQKRWGRYLLLGISVFTLVSAVHPYIGHSTDAVVVNTPEYAISAIGYLISTSHGAGFIAQGMACLLYTSPSPRD